MKKIILLVGLIVFITSCGGIGIGLPLGQMAVKDKNGVIVGYLSETGYVDSSGLGSSVVKMQDVNGDFIYVDLASGKIVKDIDTDLYFSTVNCGGTVYGYDQTYLDSLYKTHPFMTDSTKTAVDTTVADKVYESTSIAAGTETVKSFLSLDTVYSEANPYKAFDSDTEKYLCVSVATRVAAAISSGDAGSGGIGQCISSGGQVTCADEVDALRGWSYYCSKAGNTQCVGAFTPYSDQTSMPLTYETYNKYWGVLTEVAAKDITDKKVIVDYSEVAPLTIATFD